MNQVDLNGGGHQCNRVFKYLFDDKLNNEKNKLVCVIVNKTIIKSIKSKTYKIFEHGFKNDTLCYIKNLKNIIFKYFNLSKSNERNENEINENERNENEINENENEIKENENEIKENESEDIDKFYTTKENMEFCMNNIYKVLNIKKEDLIIEPSAGNGIFISEIKKLTDNYKFYDIKPENYEIEKQDFLNLDINTIYNDKVKIHTIGNPPFGRNNSLSLKFIKKCSLFSDSISFILPKSYKKQSMQDKIPMNFHLIFESELPSKIFNKCNKCVNVETIFQIWIKKNELRNKSIKLDPKYFEFVKQNENPDISVRRVGVNAGVIDTIIDTKSIQSHYFIKFINIENVKDIIEKLKTIKYEFNNTVGPKSLSKQEIIEKYNSINK
jgi:hypothetical protein